MRLRFYPVFAVAVCVWFALATVRGWSFFHQVPGFGGRSGHSVIAHK
jgi:hypothetical protein